MLAEVNLLEPPYAPFHILTQRFNALKQDLTVGAPHAPFHSYFATSCGKYGLKWGIGGAPSG